MRNFVSGLIVVFLLLFQHVFADGNNQASSIMITDTPTQTPTPVPTPVAPAISMAASQTQIEQVTGKPGNPYGCAVDSSNRLVFVDNWKPNGSTDEAAAVGSNSIMRMSLTGGTPSFEVIATKAQLGAVDSLWTTWTYPAIGIDTASDNSIIVALRGYVNPSMTDEVARDSAPTKILRVVPGSPPQISVLAQFEEDIDVREFAVDRSSTPNCVYALSKTEDSLLLGLFYDNIYKFPIDSINQTPILWKELPFDYLNMSLAIDSNGDVLYSQPLKLHRINKNTRETTDISLTNTEIMSNNSQIVIVIIASLKAVSQTGDFFGISFHITFHGPVYGLHFKLTKVSDSEYHVTGLVNGSQIIADSDVAAWYPASSTFIRSPYPFAVDDSGSFLYLADGLNQASYDSASTASRGIIRMGTVPADQLAPTAVDPRIWNLCD